MEVGLYGKLPTHGDFLRRRVSDDFIAAWDPWLQECIAESRHVLGERWLDLYLTSPVWRFAFAPTVCGAEAVAGLLVPSVDRVGRYFPLALVWPTTADLSTVEIALRCRSGFERGEQVLLETLEAEQFEFAEFDRRVLELGAHLESMEPEHDMRLTTRAARTLAQPLRQGRCVPIKNSTSLDVPALQLFGHMLDAQGPLGLWWTDGSSAVEPVWLMTRGLPTAAQFTAMLDGEWAAGQWEVGEIDFDPTQTLVRAPVPEPEFPIASVIESAAHSEAGSAFAHNQDAFVERKELRLWGVAEGLSSLDDGDIASRMVCDALADTPATATLDETIEAIIAHLREVNDYLQRYATHPTRPKHSGSTVVALAILERECAVVWAGDSRAYRWREGSMLQLTVDHTEDAGDSAVDHWVLTRAVGIAAALEPAYLRSDVRPGDRFLLCTGGIHRALHETALAGILQSGAPLQCCYEIVQQARSTGSRDNATVIIVDCAAPAPGLAGLLDIVAL